MKLAAKACKGNNAASCKYNCAGSRVGLEIPAGTYTRIMSIIAVIRSVNTVDMSSYIGVIIFTLFAVLSPGVSYAQTTAPRPQSRDSTPTRNAQPASRRRHRRVVRNRRVLRRAGSGSGQVRDASPRRE